MALNAAQIADVLSGNEAHLRLCDGLAAAFAAGPMSEVCVVVCCVG
jgi:hypothetical protein